RRQASGGEEGTRAGGSALRGGPAQPEPEATPEPEPASKQDGEPTPPAAPAAPVKGLGMARGARPPGKR
ncbi:hypothetical protein OSJ18_24645, partial [Mycobacterium ulcerans]